MNILIEKIEDILAIDSELTVVNKENFYPVKNVKPIATADAGSLVFIHNNARLKNELLKNTAARVVICDFIPENFEIYVDKCLLIHRDPKFLFAKLVNTLLAVDNTYEIHSTAVIHSEAVVHPKCKIGAYCVIGKCQIGEGTIIHANCNIYDNVTIGKNVIIDSGAVIGAAGFGYVRAEDGFPYQFPQLGGVIIEDDVEIGANTCIDRGALEDTIIRRGVKIDNLVHISHNVEIGRYTYIISQTVVAGSTKIGEKCWIAPSYIMNKIKIGDNVTVGIGSVVHKSIKSGDTYLGNPAMPLEQYSKIQFELKQL